MKEAELKILRTLCEEPFNYFSIYELAEKSNLSHTWVYKIIKELKNKNFIISDKNKIKINLEEELVIKLKEFFDIEKIYKTNLKEEILDIVHIIKTNYKDNLISLNIIGSIAKLKYTKKKSDIDFLIITKKHLKQDFDKFGLTEFENINIIELTEEEFNEKYIQNDDFIISALSSILILYDNNFIIKYLQKSLSPITKEVIKERIKQIEEIRKRLINYIKIKDYKNTKETLIQLLVLIIRIKLFQNRMLPKSKYELSEQIKKYDKELSKDLSLILKKLNNKSLLKIAEKYAFKNYGSI